MQLIDQCICLSFLAEADQLDLIYLVDCVLDEFDKAKKGSDNPDITHNFDDFDQIMPAITEEYFVSNVMFIISLIFHIYPTSRIPVM